MNRYVRKSAKILLWLVGIVIGIIVLAFILIQEPFIHNIARKKVVNYLEEKLQTKVSIGKLSIDFPKRLVLHDVYFEDQEQDTLLAGDTIRVDITMWKLLSNELVINELDMRGITAYVKRPLSDSLYNFDYILKAFEREEDKETPRIDSTSVMRFSLSKINLDRIQIDLKDDVTGKDAYVYLDHFDTNIEKFDLDKQQFSIPRITLSGLQTKIRQTKAISEENLVTDTFNIRPGFMYPDIQLGEIDISDVRLDYGNSVTAIDSKIDLNHLNIKVEGLNLKKQVVDLKSISLSDTKGSFKLGETAKEAVEATATEVATTIEKGWTIKLSTLEFENVDFSYDDLNYKVQRRGIDYDHLALKDLDTEITNILYTGDTMSARINHLSVTDTSGLDIRKFHADLYYDNKRAHLNDLLIETPNSIIRDQIQLTYPSPDTISKDISVVGINAQLINNKIAVSDILLFAPSLANKGIFRKNPDAIILVDGNVEGTVGNLNFTALKISGLGSTRVYASGQIRGLPDVNTSQFDLRIAELSTTSRDINDLIPRGSIPTNIRLPEQLSLKGNFKGSLSSFSSNLQMNSSLGYASLNGTLKNLTSKGRESYNARIQFADFDLGKFIRKEDKIGKVTLSVDVKGNGTDPKTANATFDGNIIEATYDGYTYQNLQFEGNADKGDIELNAQMNDPHIAFDLDGQANLNGTYPQLFATLSIDTLHLQQLNLHENDIRFSGDIIADLETADPDFLNGTIELSGADFRIAENRYYLDTASIVSVSTAEGDTLDLRSEFINLHMEGNYDLTKLFPALQDNIDKYFDTTPGKDTIRNYNPQQVAFTATLVRSPLVEQLLPDLREMQDASLNGQFDSNTGEIIIEGSIPRLVYKEFTVNDLALDIKTENDALNYAFTFDELSSKQLQVLNTSLSGKAKDNVLDVEFEVKDAEEKERYRIAGEFISENRMFEFSLYKDGLMLDYQPWNVTADNAIRFGKEGMMVRNLEISNGTQSLGINSSPQELNAPLDVQFTDFKIESVTRLVTKDSLLAGGTIDGVAKINNLSSNLVFTSDLDIQDFSFHGDTLGNIDLKVNNTTPDTYAAEATITGDGNEVYLKGFYYDTGEKSNYDLDVDIAQLNIKSIEGFTMGEINDGTGTLTGDLKITGTSLTPVIRGEVHFNDAGFKITRFNSFYRMNDETIRFTPEGIRLDNFTLIDSSGNEAVIDGVVETTDFKEFRLGLNLRSDNFQVLNSTRDDNELYYGKLFIDTRMRISGSPQNPAVEGTLRVKENTKLTVVVPQTDPGIVEREGIVEFVDMDTLEVTFITSRIDSLNRTEVVGMNVSVNITIDREAELNLIIDEANGDYLRVKGVGALTGGIDPSGKITLTGTYELEEGAYSFSFNQLKREFLIDKGSSITWTGEPMEANVNVTAVYIAETAPLSLVQDQLGDVEQSVINTYKQKLPFRILLEMRGELLHPNVTFDIELPERNYGVSSEIISTVNARLVQLRTQQSELNKQVFAVLLLNRFISDDPFQNDARSGSISSLARQSASKLLTEQLNNVLGGMIAGFDLNFDINSIEDYTTGELQNRTDLTVGVSRRLLDDRLTVTVGSQFELEGPKETSRKTTNIAGDVSVEYQLSKDGRYLIRAYRKNEYIVVQGQVVETGLGFVFTADYENFKDLFVKKTEEQKELRQQEREERKQERIEEKLKNEEE